MGIVLWKKDKVLLREIASRRYPIVQLELHSTKDASLRSVALPRVRLEEGRRHWIASRIEEPTLGRTWRRRVFSFCIATAGYAGRVSMRCMRRAGYTPGMWRGGGRKRPSRLSVRYPRYPRGSRPDNAQGRTLPAAAKAGGRMRMKKGNRTVMTDPGETAAMPARGVRSAAPDC